MRLGGILRQCGGAGQPRPLVAERQKQVHRADHAALGTADQVDVGLRRLPGRAEPAIDHGDHRVVNTHHLQLAEPAGRRFAVVGGRPGQQGQQGRQRFAGLAVEGRRRGGVGLLGHAAEIDADRAVLGAVEGQAWFIQFQGTRLHASE